MWTMKKAIKRRLTAVELDYFRLSSNISNLQIINAEVRQRTETTNRVIDRMELNSLKWFRQEGWPKSIFK